MQIALQVGRSHRLMHPAQPRELLQIHEPLGHLGFAMAQLVHPLLNRLLAKGWVPPLPAERLAAPLSAWPEPVAQLMLPAPEVLERCNSLAPFSEPQRMQWQRLWDQAAAKAPNQP